MQGQLLREQLGKVENNRLTLSHLEDLATGVYLLLIEIDNANYRVKFSKE